MSAAADLRRFSPLAYTALCARAGRAAKRSARRDKQWASAHGISRSRATSHRNGDASNPIVHCLAEVRVLASHDFTSALPLLCELWTEAMVTQVECKSNDALHALHEALTDDEHTADAHEDRVTQRLYDTATAAALEEAAEIDVREAEIHMLRAAVRREIARRKREGTWFPASA